MIDKRGSGSSQTDGVQPSEEELAQVTPRDLYPTSDIRFVLIELGKLAKNIDLLNGNIEKQDDKFSELSTRFGVIENRITRMEVCTDHTEKDIRESKDDFKKLREATQLDFRILFGAIIAVALGLATIMAHGFKWF